MGRRRKSALNTQPFLDALKGETRGLALLALRTGAGIFFIALPFLAIIAGAEASGPAPAQFDYGGLIAALRAEGAHVEPGGAIDQPFLSAKGRSIKVNDEEVQVFQYRDGAQADAQAALISRDGRTVRTSKIHWLGPPHFYKKGRLLVLYLGTSDRLLKTLEAALGPQFAGD